MTISRSAHPVLDQIGEFASADARRKPRLVLHALELCAAAYLREVRRINDRVDVLEEGSQARSGIAKWSSS